MAGESNVQSECKVCAWLYRSSWALPLKPSDSGFTHPMQGAHVQFLAGGTPPHMPYGAATKKE